MDRQTMSDLFKRVVPFSLAIAIVGCVSVRLLFGIPHGILGVVVAVLLVNTFIFSRFVLLAVPNTRLFRAHHVSRSIFVPFLAVFAFSSCVLIASAGVFHLIGLPAIGEGTMRIGIYASEFGAMFAAGYLLSEIPNARAINNRLRFFLQKLEDLFLDVVTIAVEIGRFLCGDMKGTPKHI